MSQIRPFHIFRPYLHRSFQMIVYFALQTKCQVFNTEHIFFDILEELYTGDKRI